MSLAYPDPSASTDAASSSDLPEQCTAGSPYNGMLELRIASIFIILATSLAGTLFPVVARRVKRFRVPEGVYEFTKYFGSGVIISTAFMHLLAPAFGALTSPCLDGVWTEYDWAPAIAMMSVFSIFIVELIAHRMGHSYLKARGLKSSDPHSQTGNPAGHSTHGAHVDERVVSDLESAGNATDDSGSDDQKVHAHGHAHADKPEFDETAMMHIIGVAILEFGVIFHSFIIGLTLAVNSEFVTLFVVLVFHQMFEGLGLGSRLSTLPLPSRLGWVPFAGAIIYSCITPLGVAIGLGVRTTYNPDGATASIVAGVLDAFSAGILLYTGLVELLAHDFIFNKAMAVDASNSKVAFSVGSVMLGAGLMAMLARWA